MTTKLPQTKRTGRTGRFDNSRNRVDAVLATVTALQVMAMIVGGKDSMIVMATSIPSMIGLIYGWTKITNEAEVNLPVLPMQKPPETE